MVVVIILQCYRKIRKWKIVLGEELIWANDVLIKCCVSSLSPSLSFSLWHKIFAKTPKCWVFMAIPSISSALVSGSPGVYSADSAQEMSSAIRGLGLWKKARRRIFAKRVSVCFYGDQPRLSSCHAALGWKPQPFAYQRDISDPTVRKYRETYVTRKVFFEKFSYILFYLYSFIYYSVFIWREKSLISTYYFSFWIVFSNKN